MKRRIFGVFMSVALIGAQIPVFAQGASARVDLAAGIRQVEEGDFETAIATLDRAVKALSSEKSAAKDLSRAYLYLAIANLGLSQETAAKARLVDALAADKNLSLSPDQYPPNVIRLFDEVRREAGISAAPQPTPEPSKKKSGSKLPLILGAAAVAGGVGYFALKGGNSAPNAGTLIIENMEIVPVASLSEVVFVAEGASDPDGDSLDFYWEFGDGHEMSGGQRMVHVYETAGDYLVVVTVSDGKKDATARNTIRVKDLTGTWQIQLPSSDPGFRMTVNQQGTRLAGSYFSPVNGNGTIEDGYLSSPRNVYVSAKIPGYIPTQWRGVISASGDSVTGTVTGFAGGDRPFTWTR
ncbi:MAG: PKD domain-containing protein [Vicinamibacteria bacterium]|nr:PKD domain-containing protein [Vicinamibacteria bacterium]